MIGFVIFSLLFPSILFSQANSSNMHPSLVEAAKSGDLETVRALLDKGAFVNARHSRLDDTTALYAASEHGHTKIVEALLKNGADVNVKSHGGRTALNAALNHRYGDIVGLLIGKGADIRKEDATFLKQILAAASAEGQAEMVKLLLDNEVDANAKGLLGYTALMVASAKGHTAIAGILLDKGAAVNAKNNSGITALHAASESGYVETVRLLVDRGADVNSKDNFGKTALYVAVERGHAETAKVLIGHGADATQNPILDKLSILDLAKRKPDKDIVRLLEEAGAKSKSRASSDIDKFLFAAENGTLGTVQDLLREGVDVNAGTGNGTTALMRATQNGHEHVVRYLLDNGADANLKKGGNGIAALMLATLHGHSRIAIILIEKGADVNAKTDDESTVLQIAAGNGHRDIVRILLKHEAEINARDKDTGKTALYCASEQGRVESVRQLLLNGADVNLNETVNGTTALYIAGRNGYSNIVTLLLNNGAKTDEPEREEEWKRAESEGTIGAYEEFLARFPDGAFSAWAYREQKELEWEVAAKSDSLDAYKKYLAANREGRHADTARERLKDIREFDRILSKLKMQMGQWEAEAPETVKDEIHIIKAYKDPVLKANAIVSLGRMGEKAKGAISVLMDAFDDTTPMTLISAVTGAPISGTSPAIESEKALSLIGAPAVEPLICELRSLNPEHRRRAAAVLGSLSDERAVTPLIRALMDANPKVRGNAAEALGYIKDRRSLGHLMKALADVNFEQVQQAASNALRSVDPHWQRSREAGKVIQECLLTLRNECSAKRRKIAADVLNRIAGKSFGTNYESWKIWWKDQEMLIADEQIKK